MRRFRAVLLLALATGAAACAAASPGTTEGLTVGAAWARPAAAGGTSAVYFDVNNGSGTDDALVGVTTGAAAGASLHVTVTNDDGMTGMHHAPSIDLPRGSLVSLQPGGAHVMLAGVTGELRPGDEVRLVLTFRRAGTRELVARVGER